MDPDPTAWQLRTESYVDEALGGHFADLLYATRLLSGAEAYVYLLFDVSHAIVRRRKPAPRPSPLPG